MHLRRLLALTLGLLFTWMSAGCSDGEPYVLPAVHEPPFSYDLYCDTHGNFVGKDADWLLARRPTHLERVYSDAQQGQPRARRLFQQLEDIFRRSGVAVADEATTSLRCLASPNPCQPRWDFMDEVLASRGPGAMRLRQAIADSFEVRARQRKMENTLILASLNLLLAGTLMKGTLAGATANAEARAATAEARTTVTAEGRTVASMEAVADSTVSVRPPANRHYARRVEQRTLARDINSVLEPRVDVTADIAAIKAGHAQVGRTPGGEISYHVNGRIYGAHANGTLYPLQGDGIHILDRGSFKALGVYNQFGNTPRAVQILDAMGLGATERAKALSVWNFYQ